MKATKTLFLSVILAGGLFGCSSDKEQPESATSEQVQVPAAPVTPAKPAEPELPQRYKFVKLEIRDGHLDRAQRELDTAIEQLAGTPYAIQSQVLKSLILGAELQVNQMVLDAVRSQIKNPLPPLTPEQKAEMEQKMTSANQTLERYEPKLKRLEALGQKRTQDLTAMELREFEEYEEVRKTVESARWGLEFAREELGLSPEKKKKIVDKLQQYEQTLQAERKALLEPFKKSARSMSDGFSADSPPLVFDIDTTQLDIADPDPNEAKEFHIENWIGRYLNNIEQHPGDKTRAIHHRFYKEYEFVAESFTYDRYFAWAADQLGADDAELKNTLLSKRDRR